MDVDGQGSFLAGGYMNRIGNFGSDQNPSFSFVGAGSFNEVTGEGDFVGAGGTELGSKLPTNSTIYGNRISGTDSFVGGGDLNAVAANGSFIGAGGYTYAKGGATSTGNSITGSDSFIGGGDLNDVAGNGSFIGAGGYTYALGGATTAGNSITGGDSFIGTGDQNSVGANEAFVGAGAANVVSSGADYSFVGGGNNNSDANQFDAIAGGQSNGINAIYGSIGGGSANAISLMKGNTAEQNGASYGAISGGSQNSILAIAPNGAQYAFIGGGLNNTVTGTYGTIAGGAYNIVSGYMATVPGGYRNNASGEFSFAGGYGAYASTAGSFLWGDYSEKAPRLAPARNGEFLVRSTGGVIFYTNAAQTIGATLPPGSGSWSNASDRNLKNDVAPVDDGAILAKVAALPVAEWSYVSERGVRHLGPMAQDFHAAFGVGEDDRHITSIDEDGVALAAIKGLNAKLARRDAELAALRRELHALESAFAASRRTR